MHKDLTFGALGTLRHHIIVHRSRAKQTLHVSIPFLPGATHPTLIQALSSQIVLAYLDASSRQDKELAGSTTEREGPIPIPGETNEIAGARPSTSSNTKRKAEDSGEGSYKKARQHALVDKEGVPSSNLSFGERLQVAKVSSPNLQPLII